MSTGARTSSLNPTTVARVVALGLLTLWAAHGVVRTAHEKRFTADEFQYAHAAWCMAQDMVPYRDFFEVHFPLVYSYMSLLFWFVDDDPTVIVHMRTMMLPFAALTGFAGWAVNHRYGRGWALFGPLLVFSLLPLQMYATEIRHDPAGFALFSTALAVLYLDRLPTQIRAFISGVFLAGACWARQKVFVYGSVFFAALLADLIVHRKRDEGYLLADPRIFLAGSCTVVALIALWLTMHGIWGAFWYWCFEWAAEYQRSYKAFSWQRHLVPMLRDLWWYLPFALVAMVHGTKRLLAERRSHDPDLILIAAAIPTFMSLSLQQAPWHYSASPFLAMTAILASRGVIVTFAWLRGLDASGGATGLYFSIVLTIMLGFTFIRVHEKREEWLEIPDRRHRSKLRQRRLDPEPQNLQGMPDLDGDGAPDDPPTFASVAATPVEAEPTSETGESSEEVEIETGEEPAPETFERSEWDFDWVIYDEKQNEYQLKVMRKIGELTSTEDAVYDQQGTYVTRPHTYFYFYTDARTRRDMRDKLSVEVPEAMQREGTAIVFQGPRSKGLSGRLKGFIRQHYQPYNGDFRVAGHAFEVPPPPKPKKKKKKKKKKRKNGQKAQPEEDAPKNAEVTAPPEPPPRPQLRQTFLVIKPGTYFIQPAHYLDSASLTIDGEPITTREFELEAGRHSVELEGMVGTIHILWLPRNGEHWHVNPSPRRWSQKH